MVRCWRHIVMVACFGLILTACANTRDLSQIERLERTGEDIKVLLMPLDVELSSLQASGMKEPNAEWSEAAKTMMLAAIRDLQSQRGAALVEFDPSRHSGADSSVVRVQKLYGAVGQSILLHKFTPGQILPTKKDRFDWSLGPSASALADEYGADYALFIFIRDSYTSGGRVALQVVGAFLGAHVPGGEQIGFASLVHLRTGDVQWFNYLHDTAGDLRSEDGAVKTVSNLLEDMPQ